MRAHLLRGLIAMAAAVAAARCGAFKDPHLKPHVWVESAHDCTHGPNCKPVPKPKEILIQVGHEHDLKIVRTDPVQIAISTDDPEIVHPQGPTDVTPTEARVVIKADMLGATTLKVDLAEAQHPNDHNSMRIRTFSPRVTVVGWVDGRAINPAAIAPGASKFVRRQFKTNRDCAAAAAEIATLGLSSNDLSFIKNPEQDRLYAQAYLVWSSANHPPSKSLAKVMQDKDFRLLNDFQTIGVDGRRFGPRSPIPTAVVGETPLPCGGGDMMRRVPWVRDAVDKRRPDRSEPHRRNGERLEANDRLAQLNQGRLGWLGRRFQHVLTNTDRGPDDITPWVWSFVAFDEKGRFVLKNAGFPTYSVYVDGELKGNCGTKQAPFEDFLKRDASWQFDSQGVDLATLNFEQGGCP